MADQNAKPIFIILGLKTEILIKIVKSGKHQFRCLEFSINYLISISNSPNFTVFTSKII